MEKLTEPNDAPPEARLSVRGLWLRLKERVDNMFPAAGSDQNFAPPYSHYVGPVEPGAAEDAFDVMDELDNLFQGGDIPRPVTGGFKYEPGLPCDDPLMRHIARLHDMPVPDGYVGRKDQAPEELPEDPQSEGWHFIDGEWFPPQYFG